MIEGEIASPGKRKALTVLPWREHQTMPTCSPTPPAIRCVPENYKVSSRAYRGMESCCICHHQIATADQSSESRRADGHVDAGHGERHWLNGRYSLCWFRFHL